MADDDERRGRAVDLGASALTPADLFENLSGERELLDAVQPFRGKMAAGPGRPRGSVNRRTIAMRDLYLRSGFPHPLLWMGSVLRMTVEDLALTLGCEPAEALDQQRKIAAEALPYIESRMPTKIAGEDGNKIPVLIMGEIGSVLAAREQRPDGAIGIDDDMAAEIINYERDQQVRRSETDKSHEARSHDTAQVTDNPPQTDD